MAAIRPDEWNLPLFLHVLGALVLVGALAAAVFYLFMARREGSAAAASFGFRILAMGAIPAYLVMRISAQWLASEQGVLDSEAAWIVLGFIVTDMGVLGLLAATIAAGIAARRASADGAPVLSGRGTAIAAWLASFMILAYAVILWAMVAKPG